MWNLAVAPRSNPWKFLDFESNYVLKYKYYMLRKAMITLNIIVEQIGREW